MSDVTNGGLMRLIYGGLHVALTRTRSLGERGAGVIHEGAAFGDHTNDTEIEADRTLGMALAEHFGAHRCVREVTVEGDMGVRKDTGALLVFIDPLDGSLNYRNRRGSLGLPYSTALTIVRIPESRVGIRFCDIVAAGVVDLRSGDTWAAVKDGGTFLNGHAGTVANVQLLGLAQQIVIGEMYYPENRALMARIFVDQRGWLRNPGSAAYEMALVSSGTAVAYVCGSQKHHELGAGYLLVTEAGGAAVDFEGHDLADHEYQFSSQGSVILASNRTVADQIVSRISATR